MQHSKGNRRPDDWLGCPLSWVGLSALAQPRLTKGGQPYLRCRLCRDAVPTLPKAEADRTARGAVPALGIAGGAGLSKVGL